MDPRRLLRFLLLLAIVPWGVSCAKDPLPEPQEEEVRDEDRTWTVTKETLHASREGIDIYGEILRPEGRTGRMPTIIFCHGLRGHYDDCLPYAEACARKGYACYCFDFIGGALANRSGGAYRDMSVLTEIADLEAVVDIILAQPFTDKDRLFLSGGSQGGLVAAMVAARNPSLARGLVLLFPAFNIPTLVNTVLQTAYGGDMANVPEKISFSGFTVYKKYAEDALGWDPYAQIGAYTGKVLILHGNLDVVVPVSYSEKAVKTYRDASLSIMKGQGHGFDERGTEEAAALALAFLKPLAR